MLNSPFFSFTRSLPNASLASTRTCCLHPPTTAPFPKPFTRHSLTDTLSTPQAAIGNVTGSQAWKASGEQAKAHGVSDMKAASEGRDASTQGYGKAEELAGKAVGCEGMVKEGDISAKKE